MVRNIRTGINVTNTNSKIYNRNSIFNSNFVTISTQNILIIQSEKHHIYEKNVMIWIDFTYPPPLLLNSKVGPRQLLLFLSETSSFSEICQKKKKVVLSCDKTDNLLYFKIMTTTYILLQIAKNNFFGAFSVSNQSIPTIFDLIYDIKNNLVLD